MPTLPRFRKPHLSALLRRPLTKRRKSDNESASPVAMPGIDFDEDAVRRILHGLQGRCSSYPEASLACSYHIEVVGDNETRGSVRTGALSVDSSGKETELPFDCRFGYGSFQKTIQSVALFKIIEEGQKCLHGNRPLPARVWEIMEDSWEKPALEILNKLRAFRDSTCRPWPEPRRMPTIEGVLTHCYAFTTSQRYVFAPDGTFLLDEDTLSETLARLTDAEPNEGGKGYQYNNLNAIIAGLIIKYAMGCSLSEALKILVLRPLKMYETIVDMAAFNRDETSIQPPFVTTADGSYEPTSVPCYLHDDVELAAGGGYTSARDVAKLLLYLMEDVENTESAKYKRFFRSKFEMTNLGPVRQSYLSGYCGFLDSEAFGNQSFEAVNPSHPQNYALGRRDGGSVQAIWKAGAVKGYSCHYYMIPAMSIFIIVLCNSSGIIDPAHHVARYLLQMFLSLDKQDAIDLEAPEIVLRQKQAVKRSTAGMLHHCPIDARERACLEGTYVDEKSQQHLIVEEVGGELTARLSGNGLPSGKSTPRMGLFKITEQVLALQPEPSSAISPDFYHAWRDFALEIVWDGTTVSALQRVSASSTGLVVNDPKAECETLYVRQTNKR